MVERWRRVQGLAQNPPKLIPPLLLHELTMSAIVEYNTCLCKMESLIYSQTSSETTLYMYVNPHIVLFFKVKSTFIYFKTTFVLKPKRTLQCNMYVQRGGNLSPSTAEMITLGQENCAITPQSLLFLSLQITVHHIWSRWDLIQRNTLVMRLSPARQDVCPVALNV